MFIGSLILAYSVEQSGLHLRLAYGMIRLIGYSHVRLLLSLCIVTTFISMWITNTAATTMMVPLCFAVLRVFESQNLLNVYKKNSEGEDVATDITVCYFCTITYSATVGGIGTLIGTGTNLVFKGLFMTQYPSAPEYLSFPLYSGFAVPMMIALAVSTFLSMAVVYLGLLRPGSKAAKETKITPDAKRALKKQVDADWKRLGMLTYWEIMVIILFGGGILAFFCRSPQIFKGWGDAILEYYGIKDNKFVRDSALAMFVSFLMFLLPSNLDFFKNCTAKYKEDLPKERIRSVLDWRIVITQLPYSFCFLLGGGFALSDAARKTGLNEKIGEVLQGLKNLPNVIILLMIIIVVVFVTNFASNVAVCNVVAPIAMQLAKEINRNPLWYDLAAGIAASFCFMIPVGTPGNLVVQSAAKIPTSKMIVAGALPTVFAIIIIWIMVYFWAPVVWPDIHLLPQWVDGL
ncbi:protein I'm not dead yet-like isoform X2 [Aricia agestis]|nr:protein I'm not dead yet-like isoform X2 [Aricia agestis]